MGENEGGQMHQLLAVKGDLHATATTVSKKTLENFGKRHMFDGALRTYEHFDSGEDKDQTEEPEEHSDVAATVGENLQHFAEYFSPYLDCCFQMDSTNRKSSGEIKLDGLEMTDIPTTFLMQLKNIVPEIRKVLDAIPTLDAKHDWENDKQFGPAVYKSTKEEVTYRTSNTHHSKILVEPTDHHPAQIKEWTEVSRIGKYIRKAWSSRLTAHQKYVIMVRLNDFEVEVKRALSEANQTAHVTSKVGEKIFNYLLKDIPLDGVSK